MQLIKLPKMCTKEYSISQVREVGVGGLEKSMLVKFSYCQHTLIQIFLNFLFSFLQAIQQFAEPQNQRNLKGYRLNRNSVWKKEKMSKMWKSCKG